MHIQKSFGQEVRLLGRVRQQPCLLRNSPCLKCFQSKMVSVVHVSDIMCLGAAAPGIKS